MDKPISPPYRDRDGARRKAHNHFEAADNRTSLVKQMTQTENAATDAKTKKLKALRLAKEEAEAAELAANPPPATVKKKAAKKSAPSV